MATENGSPASQAPTGLANTDKQAAESQNGVPPQVPATPAPLPSPASSDKDAPTEKTAQEAAALRPTESRASQLSTSRIAIIIISLCMALFLAALDITIITTALPTIATHFHASSASYSWVGSAYMLAAAAAAPVWGKISDIWGRKPILLLANSVFMLGSLIAGLSNSIGMLIGARAIQGIGGGGLIVLVYVCIGDLFSMRDRPKWYGIMGMTWAIASGVGPIVGGVFTEKLVTPKTALVEGIKTIDWIGVLTIVGGVVMFLFGMESGGVTHAWDSAFTLCLIIFGIIVLAIFFFNEWKFAKYPIIPTRIFKHVSNLATLGVCFFHGFVFIGGGYYLPLYFQVVLGASPILSGVYLFALVFMFSLASGLTGFFMKKTGLFRPPIWFGLVVMTLGFGLCTNLPDHKQWSKIIIYQMIAGFGVGPNFQAPLIALQSHLKGYDIAVGTATFGFVRNVSTALSVVLGGVVFQNQLKKHASRLEQALGPELGRRLSSSAFGTTSSQLKSLTPEQHHVVASVYTDSLQKLWIFYTAFAAAGIVVSLFIKKKELSREHETTKTGLQEQERVRQEEKANRDARKQAKRDVERGSIDKNSLPNPTSPNSA
ncbi:hypothetical protein DV737_g2638, partial [Chaetothyriales sp. CBS 132003]